MPPKKKARAKATRPPVPAGVGRALFPTLPTEIIHAIIEFGAPIDVNEPLDRDELLFALSRTCQRLRGLTLAPKWELFDITRTRYPGGWTTGIPDDLERKSLVLAKLKHLHPLVKHVRVILTRRRTDEILGALVILIEKLTSVTTLEITHAHTAMTTHLKNAFEGHTFPNIRTVIIPPQAHNVLRSCSGVRSVTVNDMSNECSKLITAISVSCNQVEEVKDFHLETKQNLKNLIKAAPNIRSIHFGHVPSEGFVQGVKPLKKLNRLAATIYVRDRSNGGETKTVGEVLALENVKRFIAEAKELLKERKDPVLVIDHRNFGSSSSATPVTQCDPLTFWSHTIDLAADT